jgi:peptidoglycan/LPS O-acetylase OafA/YrhL
VFNNLAVDAINGSLWTLKNEVAFYFIVPLLHKVFHRRGAKVLFYIYGFSVAYMLYFYYGDIVNLWGSRSLTSEKMLVQFPAQLRLFLVGIILYIYFDKFATYRPALSATISLIFVIVFREEAIFRATVYPLFLGVCLIYAVYFIKPVIIRFDFSFSFYIVHFPLIQLSLLFGFNPVNPVASFALLFFLTILISFLSEMYIERPSIGFGKTLIRRRP